MAVALPEGHPLAGRPEVELADLAGQAVYAGAGNPRTREWTELAARLFAGHGVRVAAPAPLAVGKEEFRRLMAKNPVPVLAVVDFPPLPDTVLRPLVRPVPLSPVALVWRKGLRHPGLDALRGAAAELAARESGWPSRRTPGCRRPTPSPWATAPDGHRIRRPPSPDSRGRAPAGRRA